MHYRREQIALEPCPLVHMKGPGGDREGEWGLQLVVDTIVDFVAPVWYLYLPFLQHYQIVDLQDYLQHLSFCCQPGDHHILHHPLNLFYDWENSALDF